MPSARKAGTRILAISSSTEVLPFLAPSIIHCELLMSLLSFLYRPATEFETCLQARTHLVIKFTPFPDGHATVSKCGIWAQAFVVVVTKFILPCADNHPL